MMTSPLMPKKDWIKLNYFERESKKIANEAQKNWGFYFK